MVSQFMYVLKSTHFETVYNTLSYLKGTYGKDIIFEKLNHFHVEVYMEAY